MREIYTVGGSSTPVLDVDNHILNPVRIFEFRNRNGILKYRHVFGPAISFSRIILKLQYDIDEHNSLNEEKLTWENIREVLRYGETHEL